MRPRISIRGYVRPSVCRLVTRYFWFLEKRVKWYSSGVCVCVHACVCMLECPRDKDASIVCLPNLLLSLSNGMRLAKKVKDLVLNHFECC